MFEPTATRPVKIEACRTCIGGRVMSPTWQKYYEKKKNGERVPAPKCEEFPVCPRCHGLEALLSVEAFLLMRAVLILLGKQEESGALCALQAIDDCLFKDFDVPEKQGVSFDMMLSRIAANFQEQPHSGRVQQPTAMEN